MTIIWPSILTLVKFISPNFCKSPALSKAVFHHAIDPSYSWEFQSQEHTISHTKLPQPVVLEVCYLFIFEEVSTRIGITLHFGN